MRTERGADSVELLCEFSQGCECENVKKKKNQSYPIQFNPIQSNSVQFNPIQSNSVQINSTLTNPICSTQSNSIHTQSDSQFNSIQHNPIQSHSTQFNPILLNPMFMIECMRSARAVQVYVRFGLRAHACRY